MVIDKNHPLAPHCVVLREGKVLEAVTRIDTLTMTLWRSEAEFGSLSEESFDEIRYNPNVPSYLRFLVPPEWKPHTLLN